MDNTPNPKRPWSDMTQDRLQETQKSIEQAEIDLEEVVSRLWSEETQKSIEMAEELSMIHKIVSGSVALFTKRFEPYDEEK